MTDIRRMRRIFYDFNIYVSFASRFHTGVITFVRNTIKIQNFQTDSAGRLVVIDFKFLDNFIRILNIYAPPDAAERKRFFNSLDSFLNTSRVLILIGDFNNVLQSVDKNLPLGPDSTRKVLSELVTAKNLDDTYRKLYPNVPGYTWFGRGWLVDSIEFTYQKAASALMLYTPTSIIVYQIIESSL